MRLLPVILFLFTLEAHAQIVNTETQRMQSDTTGWMGTIGTSFSYAKNVQEVLDVSLLAHVQYKTRKDLWLFLANYDYLRGNAETLSNNVFFHLRYNHKLTPALRWELFTQLQKNAVTGIDARWLLGTGPRLKIAESEKLKMYVGVDAMYEYEREHSIPVVLHYDIRNSDYLSFTYTPVHPLEIINTFFYQPLFKKLSDFRLLDELRIDVKVGKHFSFLTSLAYLYDSFPAASLPRVNYTLSNGLDYAF